MTHAERRESYRAFLEGQSLRFNFGNELADYANKTRDGVQNDTPPPSLWLAILPTVRVLEKVREQFGPTTITSAFRAPSYNVAIGGEKASWHMRNRAIDFKCKTGTPKEWAAYLRQLRAAGEFEGGIGVYSTFVHVDTRGTRADW